MKRVLFRFAKIFHKKLRYSHLIAFLRYNSFRKIENLLRNRYERKNKRIVLKSKPFLVNAEPTNHCNFRCLFCPTGKRDGRPAGYGGIQSYQRLFEQISSTVYLITLHGWGEPLLHKDLPEIVRLAHTYHIGTVVSSNGSLLNESVSRKLITSKLDCLIFSIDGATEESYSQYRKGGNFHGVLKNLQELIHLKKEMGSNAPFIEWQFLVFKHNEHEIPVVKKLARDVGVDNLVILPAYTEDAAYDATDSHHQLPKRSPLSKPSDCKHLWTTASFHWNGAVVPCCYDYPEQLAYGNLDTEPFDQIWNNAYFQQSRNLVANGRKSENDRLYCIQCLETIDSS